MKFLIECDINFFGVGISIIRQIVIALFGQNTVPNDQRSLNYRPLGQSKKFNRKVWFTSVRDKNNYPALVFFN